MKDKIVKLTSAVYNLLEYFPESDPLKNKVKEKALVIMENLSLSASWRICDENWVSLKDYFSDNREKVKLQTLEDIGILLNYLKLASLQGWINGVSFLIVFNEYERVRKDMGAPIIIPELEKIERQSPLSHKVTARQSKILEFLEHNQKAQVMDLMTVLPDVTKRTIRRDLDELLKIGKVVREGEFSRVLYKIL